MAHSSQFTKSSKVSHTVIASSFRVHFNVDQGIEIRSYSCAK